jgi:glycosyltransferase involved in cell wall biosynthesis
MGMAIVKHLLKRITPGVIKRWVAGRVPRYVIAPYFDPSYYVQHNPDIFASGENPIVHFLASGWREGRRPNDWFDQEAYLQKHPHLDPKSHNVFLHYVKNLDTTHITLRCPNPQTGRKEPQEFARPHPSDIVQTEPYFDTEYYRSTYPQVAATGIEPHIYFLIQGWKEGHDPSAEFSVSSYLRRYPDVAETGYNPLVHYVRTGQIEGRIAYSVARETRHQKVPSSAKMISMIAAAEAIEPMIKHPLGAREIVSPVFSAAPLINPAKHLRETFAGQNYPVVMCISQVRLSGVARLAAKMMQALVDLYGADNILLVMTDLSDASHLHWFPQDVKVLDLADVTAGLSSDNQSRILLDLLRGVNARTVINIHSRLLWETTQVFGRQLSQEYRLITYLFTWDIEPDGTRVGYPVEWLRHTVPWHHLLLTDAHYLADEISQRFGLDKVDAFPQVQTLLTPVEHFVKNRQIPAASDPPRFLWSGRFDRQKRLDILVRIAQNNPNVIFDVYGKAVLDDRGLEAFDLPANLHLKGTYSDFQDILDTPYHGFLYTSAWDGIPNMILEAAAAGFPIVAPNVGGIAEVITQDTGWLIDSCDDVDAFCAALEDILQNPDRANERGKRAKEHVTQYFNDAVYKAHLQDLLKGVGAWI